MSTSTGQLLIDSQRFLGREGEVGAEEVLGTKVPGAFFGDDDVDFLRYIFNLPVYSADMVGAGRGLIVYSRQFDPLVRLVPERLVVNVDAHFPKTTVGFDCTKRILPDFPMLFPLFWRN